MILLRLAKIKICFTEIINTNKDTYLIGLLARADLKAFQKNIKYFLKLYLYDVEIFVFKVEFEQQMQFQQQQ